MKPRNQNKRRPLTKETRRLCVITSSLLYTSSLNPLGHHYIHTICIRQLSYIQESEALAHLRRPVEE